MNTTPAFLSYPDGQSLLADVANMGDDVTAVLVGLSTVWSIDQLALVDEVCVELPTGNCDFLAIGVACGCGKNAGDYINPGVHYWGTICVSQLLLHLEDASDLECLTIRRSMCELRSSMQFLKIQNVPRVMPVTLAAVYDPLPDGTRMETVLPLTPFNLDTCRRLMVQRMRQYRSPDDGCLLHTDADRRCDRLSYILAAAAVAHGTSKFFSRGAKDAWLKGEMSIARYRLRAAHVPQLLAASGWGVVQVKKNKNKKTFDFSAMHGIPVLDALELMPHALTARAAIVQGHLVADLPLWGRIVLREQQKLHMSNLSGSHPDFGDRAVVFAHIFREFYHVISEANVKIKNTHSSVLRPAKTKRTNRVMSLEDGTPLLQVQDLRDLQRVMPGCMRELADRAFLPHVQPHLKYQDRNYFYEFVLANGIDAEELEQAVVLKFDGLNHDTRDLHMAIKTRNKHVHSSIYGTGYSCKRLMNEGYCPHFKSGSGEVGMSKARIACHSNQMNLVQLVRPEIKTDPDGTQWSIGFPLLFSQKVQKLITSNDGPTHSLQHA